LTQLFWAVESLVVALFSVALDYWAPAAWILYFLFAVRWSDLRPQLKAGGWTAIALLYLASSLTWGLCSKGNVLPGFDKLDAPWGSIAERSIFAAAWVGVAFLCGHIQDLWNLAPPAVEIAGPPEGPAVAGHGHGHDDHAHGHGHDDHHGHGHH
jgi:hypothetical protein